MEIRRTAPSDQKDGEVLIQWTCRGVGKLSCLPEKNYVMTEYASVKIEMQIKLHEKQKLSHI